MYKKILLFSTLTIIGFSGCSTKEYYTPKDPQNLSTQDLGDTLIHYSRDGATLESGKILTKQKSVNLKIDKGFYFINRINDVAITADLQGNCHLRKEKKIVHSIKFEEPLVAATIMEKQLIFLLQNNNFGVYNLEKKSIIYRNKSKKAYSIDRRIANPLPVERLVVIPSLDGKLIILDLSTLKIVKEMYVSTEKTLNNIIFLQQLQHTLVASTPYKILSVSNEGKKELEAGVSDVIIDKNEIFAFLKDGRILKMDKRLSIVSEKKFKFAHFSIASIYQNKIYAIDKQGYIIVSNKELSKHKVYHISEIDDYAFVSAGQLYFGQNTINLTSLNYE